MAQKISQMTEQTTSSMTEAGTSDFLGGYTTTGGNANRKFSLSGLANYFLNKFKMTLGGSSQTVKSAIDALNSNALQRFTIASITDHEQGVVHTITISSSSGGNIPGEGVYLVTIRTINSVYDAVGIMSIMNRTEYVSLFAMSTTVTLTRTSYDVGTLSINLGSYTGLDITVTAVKLA